MLTNIDRKSRYIQAKKLIKRTCKHTNNAIKEVLSIYPNIYSLTLDNDILFQHHTEIRDELNIQTYFCHPYHSWEK
jgi:IS30 family transposase